MLKVTRPSKDAKYSVPVASGWGSLDVIFPLADTKRKCVNDVASCALVKNARLCLRKSQRNVDLTANKINSETQVNQIRHTCRLY